MIRRIVLPSGALGSVTEEDRTVVVPEAIARHLMVLRLEPGTRLVVTDGDGREAEATLGARSKRGTVLDVFEVRSVPAPRPVLVLLQGVGKGEKLDHVVRAVGELGAARVVPVWSARSVRRAEGRVDRLKTIADDALRVSGRAHRMRVDPPLAFAAAVQTEGDLKLFLSSSADETLKTAVEARARRPEKVVVLVGPEGGFSAEEEASAVRAGFRSVHVGPHILRTETAGPAVVAMLSYALGPFEERCP